MKKRVVCFIISFMILVFSSGGIVYADQGTDFFSVLKSEGYMTFGDSMTGQGGAYDGNWNHFSEFDAKDISSLSKLLYWDELTKKYVEKGFIEDWGTISNPYFIFSPWVSCVDFSEVSGNNAFLLTFWIYDNLSNYGNPNGIIIAAGGKNYSIANLSSTKDQEEKDRYKMVLTFGEDDLPLLDAITSGEDIIVRIYGQTGDFWQRNVNANEDSMVSTRKLYQAYHKALETIGAKPSQGSFLNMSVR